MTSACQPRRRKLPTHKSILDTTMDDDKKKAAFYKLYDLTKGGADIVNQRNGFLHLQVQVAQMVNGYQQLVIRNPYLESNYFVKFAVYFIILWHSLYLVYHFLSLPDWKFDKFCTFWVFLFDSMIVLLFAVQILIIWGFSQITRNYAETIPFHKISTLWN